MPIGAMGTAGQQAFALIRRLRTELEVNTTCGASNVSFGLPNRHAVTGTFLAMAIGAGMTSAIMSPLHAEVKAAVMAADVLAGQDKDCMAWIRANRDPDAPAGGREGRDGGRRRRRPTE
jgi:5-methyltetrahydrofolate--homocysteine methyltransferase